MKGRWDGFAEHFAFFSHNNTDIVLISLFLNVRLSSVYSVYSMVVTGLVTIIVAIITSFNATFGFLYSKGEKEALSSKFNQVLNICTFLTISLFGICLFLITPFIGTLSQRFEGGNTDEDLGSVLSGKFGNDYDPQASGDATMLYRFAWCYERLDYLVQRPVAEQIFGMGLCSDGQDWVNTRYRFQIGLVNKEFNNVTQLSTPDIAYGNMITYLGIGGMVCYLLFCISLTRFFWLRRKCSPMFLYLASYGIIMYISAFSGSSLSESKTFSFMFLIMSLAFHPNGTGSMAFDSTKTK